MPSTPQSDAEIVSRLRAAGCVFAEEEAALLMEAASTSDSLDAMVARRVQGTPLEQIVGWARFCGLRIVVEPGVFVPRRRTEYLVWQVAALAEPNAVVLDMCCGSGAVAAALRRAVPSAEVYAVDIDPAAVRCARRNLPPERVFEGDLFDPLPASLKGRVSILVANAPYVPTDAISMMPPEARLHEALVALDGGEDGLDVQRRVIMEATEWLAPEGHLLIETSGVQAPETMDAFVRAGFEARVETSDEFDATVVIGRKPAS